MEWQRAMADLSHGELSPVYILKGDEHVLTHLLIERIRRRIDENTGLVTGVTRFWSDDGGLDEAIRVCQSMQLFGAGDVVVLERCLLFGAGGKAKPTDSTLLEQYLTNPIASRVLVITVPKDAWDERKKVAKLAKGHCVVDCTTPKPEVSVDILQQFILQRSWNISQKVLAEVVRRSTTISQAIQELNKLAAYCDGASVRMDDVAQVVMTPLEDNIFEWLGLVMEGKADAALRTISDVLLSGNDLMGLVAMLARQVRMMWYAVWANQHGAEQSSLARRLGAHPYAIKVASQQARGLSLSMLDELLLVIADAEYAIKSGRRDATQALDYIVMSCLSISQQKRRVR